MARAGGSLEAGKQKAAQRHRPQRLGQGPARVGTDFFFGFAVLGFGYGGGFNNN